MAAGILPESGAAELLPVCSAHTRTPLFKVTGRGTENTLVASLFPNRSRLDILSDLVLLLKFHFGISELATGLFSGPPRLTLCCSAPPQRSWFG